MTPSPGHNDGSGSPTPSPGHNDGSGSPTPSRGRLPGAEHALFGGYAPFVALLALIVAMALLAPTIAPEREVITHPGPAPAAAPSAPSGVDLQRTGVADQRQSEAAPAEGVGR